MEIQIFNPTGERIKTLNLSSPGILHGGLNEIKWNGSDDHGAALSQGIYFYKVIIRMNNKQPINYSMPQDAVLQQGYGKIIILRN